MPRSAGTLKASSCAVQGAGALAPDRISSAGVLLVVLAFWMLLHAYEGLVHDSVLYAFGALARLHPDSLAHDIYLSVGVQDRHTIFSPLIAPLIRLAGVERAAALATLAAQLAFFGCCWCLARRLLSPAEALLSLALIVILPPQYGDGHIFSYAESFMTPRLPSEALVLGGLLAVLRERYLAAGLCLISAALLHPIIAAAGVALLFALCVGVARPKVAVCLALGGFGALIALAWLNPFGPVARLDTGWFDLLYDRGAYLFPSRWAFIDWAHASVPLATLAVGGLTVARPPIRSLCLAGLVTGLSGLVISLIGSDLLRIVLVAQAQPWRWLWLSNALAVLLMPVIFKSCWSRADARRSAAVLLAAAWVCIDEPYVPVIEALALLAVATARHIVNPRHVRLLFLGAWAMLALGLLVLAAYVLRVSKQIALIPPDPALYDSPYLLELRRWKPWQAGGVLPALIFLAAWWAATRRKGTASALAVLTLGLVLCVALAHLTWNAWTRVENSDELYAEFAPWREAMPKSSQVLWLDDAFPVWYLLQRPSYWSRSQTSASVYSEAMARELARREWIILAVQRSTREPRQVLFRTCRNNPMLDFYVSPVDMGSSPFPVLKNPKRAGSLRLYRCADYRR